MAKLLSKYLNKEIDVVYNETEIGGVPTTIITHDSLEDVILNQIPEDVGVRYDKTLEHMDPEHCVVKCTFADKKGRRVQCFGESLPSTLYTDIAKTIPCIMAEIRAFDRAAIRYLNLPGKVYSNEEGVKVDIPAAGTNVAGSNSSETFVDPADYTVIDEITEEEIPHLPPKETVQTNTAKEKPATIVSKPVEKREENTTPATRPVAANSATNDKGTETATKANAGAVVVSFGKYQYKPVTVAEICDNADEQEKKWIDFVLNKMNTSDAEKHKQIEALRYYMTHKGA